MYILGISGFYHDSAACLIQDGEILAAAQEERFTRKRHDPRFPENAIQFLLKDSNITIDEVDHIIFYDKPILTFDRLLMSYLTVAPKGLRSWLQAMPKWLKQNLYVNKIVQKETGYRGDIFYSEHHEAHSASAFYPSPFEDAAVLTIDGVGEWATGSYGIGEGNRIKILKELRFPDSLGLLYSAFTYFTGFKVNSGEYKLMGLAPYGEPRFKDMILSELIDIKKDGSMRLNLSYFDFLGGLKMTHKRFDKLFGGPPRKPEMDITQREMDIAASIQVVTEEIILKMANHVYQETKKKNLCLAGGVALNCVANGRVLREGPFENIWIQPAAGDAGGALGAALLVWYQYLENERVVAGKKDAMKGAYLGSKYEDNAIKDYLDHHQIPHTYLKDDHMAEKVADLIADQKVIGWFQGRMEFGPRALGSRSIIGDARSPQMQEKMNLKIKFRESFRPFAPSVTEERCKDYFEMDGESPYMLLVASVHKRVRHKLSEEETKLSGLKKLYAVRSQIPAVTHVDYTARIHTVNKDHNSRLHQVLSKFDEIYGCPVVINTSFNVRGEPIVCSPEDAFMCFMRTNMDFLLMGNLLLDKNDQKHLAGYGDGGNEFELD